MKPISTLELASTAVSLVKTATVVLVLMLLEWSKLKERRAKVEAASAENDLAVAKVTAEVKNDGRTDAQVLDEFLHHHGPPVDPTGVSITGH
jgi:hypothetical protein